MRRRSCADRFAGTPHSGRIRRAALTASWALSAVFLFPPSAWAESSAAASSVAQAASSGGQTSGAAAAAERGFVPADSLAAERGRQVAARFDLSRRFEFAFQVNNAFTAQNRTAIAAAEHRIASIPGVRKVVGPAGLLTVTFDAEGRAVASPLLAGGPDGAASEAVRQRLIRRSDAVGWFIARDGTEIRLLIDGDDLPAVRPAIEVAAASSGLVLLSGGAATAPLWPEPDREPRPFPSWLPLLLVVATMVPSTLVIGIFCRPTLVRTIVAMVAAGVAAAAPGILAPTAQLRHVSVAIGAGAAAVVLTVVVLARVSPFAFTRRGRPTVRAKAPLGILVPCLVLVAAGVVFWRRVSLATQLWRETAVFFVEVRGELEEPVVMRELRRLTDFLRAQPGVAHAWSVADLFFAIRLPGEEAAGIPASSALLHTILARARDDSAVRLELAADHRQALVGVRWDDASGVDRLAMLERFELFLEREHRPALLQVDVSDPRWPAATRAVGRGILATDARDRILRICARSGRNLSDAETTSIERGTRRAALLPTFDLPKVRRELSQEVSTFLEQVAIDEALTDLPPPIDRQRLADDLSAQPAEATLVDVLGPLATMWGKRLPAPTLRARAAELQRRLAAVRRRHSARNNFSEILYGADLPTEGVLSEEVRDATLEAMGPIVGVPVPPTAPGAWTVAAVTVGGAPNDRALSIAWRPRVEWGLLITAGTSALLLLVIGGARALAWWPAALAPAAPLILFPAIAAVPIGALYLSVVSGALAAGASFAVAYAPARRDP